MSLPFMIAGTYAIAIAAALWLLRNQYFDLAATAQRHAVNLLFIAITTIVAIAATWNVFAAIFLPSVAHPSILARQTARLILIYELIPTGVFIARYGAVDLGGYSLERWPAAIVGWTLTLGATAFLLLARAALAS